MSQTKRNDMENFTKMQITLIEYYLEYLNDYLSIDKFAEHKGLTPKLANDMVFEGRDLYDLFMTISKKKVAS